MLKLTLIFKDKVIREIDIDKAETSIGRAVGNDICIENLAVSNQHARILKQKGQYVIEDLNSTNGTFVDEQRVNRLPLSNGQQITIGKHNLQVAIDSGDQARQAALGDTTMALDTEKHREMLNKQ
jgi:pSer/pThr/pTyr-binding forkhead associated (FHA) protein